MTDTETKEEVTTVSQSAPTEISRRRFLKVLGAGAATLFLGGIVREAAEGAKLLASDILTDDEKIFTAVALAKRTTEKLCIDHLSKEYGLEVTPNLNYQSPRDILQSSVAYFQTRHPGIRIIRSYDSDVETDRTGPKFRELIGTIGITDLFNQFSGSGITEKIWDAKADLVRKSPYLKAAAWDIDSMFPTGQIYDWSLIIGSSKYPKDPKDPVLLEELTPVLDYFFDTAQGVIAQSNRDGNMVSPAQFVNLFLEQTIDPKTKTANISTALIDAAIASKLLARNPRLNGRRYAHIRQYSGDSAKQEIVGRFMHVDDCYLSLNGNWLFNLADARNLGIDPPDKNASVLNAVGAMNHELYILALMFHVHPTELARSVLLQQIVQINQQGFIKATTDLRSLESTKETIKAIKKIDIG